jgi:hypothetical protein
MNIICIVASRYVRYEGKYCLCLQGRNHIYSGAGGSILFPNVQIYPHGVFQKNKLNYYNNIIAFLEVTRSSGKY